MNRRQIAWRCSVLALSAFVLGACASARVRSYAIRGFEARQFRTYSWGPADTHSTGDPRLDNNEFFIDRVHAQVDAGLARKGFEKVGAAPDVLLHFHANVTQQIDVRGLDAGYVNDPEATEGRTYVFDAGTLFIDLVDPRTNTLVWRGWAEASLEGVIDNQASMETRIDDAVRRILQRLPPGL